MTRFLSGFGPIAAAGVQILPFTSIPALYAATSGLEAGQVCRVSWPADDYVDAGQILTVWDGAAFLPDPLTQPVDLPGYIFGENWSTAGNAASETLTYDDAGRPILSMDNDESVPKFAIAKLATTYARDFVSMEARARFQNFDAAGGQFTRAGVGVCKPAFASGDTSSCAFVGARGNGSTLISGYSSAGTYGADNSAGTTVGFSDDDLWKLSFDSIQSAASSTRDGFTGTANIDGDDTARAGGGVPSTSTDYFGNQIANDRIAVVPFMTLIDGSGGGGGETMSITLLSIRLAAAQNFDGRNIREF